jgi:hypothetical protein
MREAANPLDPDALTLGFAQRFTGYKRPNLLVENLVRLSRPLNDPARPVHLVLAGKAHPADSEGKKMIRDWIAIAAEHVMERLPIGNLKQLRGKAQLLPRLSCAGIGLARVGRGEAFDVAAPRPRHCEIRAPFAGVRGCPAAAPAGPTL